MKLGRQKSGDAVLDDMLDGGFTKGRLVLVRGPKAVGPQHLGVLFASRRRSLILDLSPCPADFAHATITNMPNRIQSKQSRTFLQLRLVTLFCAMTFAAILLAFWRHHGETLIIITVALSVAGLAISIVKHSHRKSATLRRACVSSLALVLSFALSFGPATRQVVLHEANASLVTTYQTIYSPIPRFARLLPAQLGSLYRKYVILWFPKELTLDDSWPTNSHWLIHWSSPNKNDRINSGVPMIFR